MAPEENDQLKPLSAKPLGYFLAILGGFFTAGPLGLVVSPLALMAIAKVQKRDAEKPPNRFLTWALVGIIGAPVCGAVSFFGGTALIALTAPKGSETIEGSPSASEASGDQLPTMTTFSLKNDTDYPIDKVLLSFPGRDTPFVPQQSNADSRQSVDVLLGNGTMDALPCTMDATVQYSDGEKKELGSLDFCANSGKTLVVRYPDGSDFE